MHSCPLSHRWTTFVKAIFPKSIIFRVENTFELPHVFKWVIKTIFINSNPFALLIINVNFFPIWKSNSAHLVGEKKLTKNPLSSLSASNMQNHSWFVSNFERVNFAINENYSNKTWWQSKVLCFACDLSNIWKYSFKECPFTWVARLIAILPILLPRVERWT